MAEDEFDERKRNLKTPARNTGPLRKDLDAIVEEMKGGHMGWDKCEGVFRPNGS